MKPNRLSILNFFIFFIFYFPHIIFAETAPSSPQNTKESFQTDLFTGAAGASYPIATPPGTNGMQPSLALTYNSRGGNGWIGAGWELSGLGYIELTHKDLFNTRAASGMGSSCIEDATLYLNGHHKLLVDNNNRSKIYTERDAFLDIAFNDDVNNSSWLIRSKDGLLYSFGSNTNSRIGGEQSSPYLCHGIRRWMLDKVTDTNGNYMEIKYKNDNSGAAYPSSITYTKNDSSPLSVYRTVEFTTGGRADIPVAYPRGSEVKILQRLSKIEVSMNGTLLRRYILNYTNSPNTGVSLLTAIDEYGADKISKLPSTTFDYNDEGIIITSQHRDIAGKNMNYLPGDYDGDGEDEFVYWGWVDKKGSLGEDLGKYVLTGGDIAWTSNAPQIYPDDEEIKYYAAYSGDFNGDGKTDLLERHDDGWEDGYLDIKISDGSKLNTELGWRIRGYVENSDNSDINWSLGIHEGKGIDDDYYPADFNGDGKTDVFAQKHDPSRAWGLFISNGEALSLKWAEGGSIEGWSLGNFDKITPGDYNGDGKTDIFVHSDGNTVGLFLSHGNSFHKAFMTGGDNDPYFEGWPIQGGSDGNRDKYHAGDFNGDGMADIFVYNNKDNCAGMFLSKGDKFIFTERVCGSLGGWDLIWDDVHTTGDFNGDGKADIAVSRGSREGKRGGGVGLLLSIGSNPLDLSTYFKRVDNDAVSHGAWKTVLVPINFDNKDNKTDLFIYDSDGAGGKSIDTSGMTAVDSLKTISGSFGSTTSIEYKFSPSLPPDLPFTVPVVDKVTTSDGMGNSYTTSYLFSNGKYDKPSREFRGFGYVKVTEPSDIDSFTENIFHQDEIKKGMLASTEWRLASDNQLYKKKENSYDENRLADSTIEKRDGTGKVNIYRVLFNGDTTTTYLDGTKSVTNINYYDNADEKKYGNSNATETIDENGNGIRTELTYRHNETKNIHDRVGSKTIKTITNNIPSDGKNYSTSYTYNDNGSLTTVSGFEASPVGSISYELDAWGNRTKVTSGRNTSSTDYDSLYHTYPIRSTNELEHQAASSYYGVPDITGSVVPVTSGGIAGALESSSDPNGYKVSYFYDPLGRKVLEEDGTGSRKAYEYFIRDGVYFNMASVFDNGIWSYNYMDGFGRTYLTVNMGGNGDFTEVWTNYDSRSRVKDITLPATVKSAYKTTISYDILNRELFRVNPDGTSNISSYNGWEATYKDEKGNITSSTTDILGRLKDVVDPEGGLTTYDYDTAGNITNITDADGNITEIDYDETLGRKIFMNDPDMGVWTYTYDPDGNLQTQTDEEGNVISMTYDPLNRILTKTLPDTTSVTNSYDQCQNGKGRLCEITDQSGTETYSYDIKGRVTSSTKTILGSGKEIKSFYNTRDQVTDLILPTTEAVNNAYQEDTALLYSVGSQTYNKDIVAGLKYNELNKPIYKLTGNFITSQLEYHPQNLRLTSVFTKDVSNRPPVAEITADILTGAPPLQVTFTSNSYDPDGTISLWRWEFGDGTTAFTESVTHTYSKEGVYTASLTVTDSEGLSAAVSVIVKVFTGKPSPPANLTASGGVGKIKLTWKGNSKGDKVTGYKIYRRLAADTSFTQLTLTAANITTYSDNAVTSGIRYYYAVAAVNIVGEGGLSNEVSGVSDDYGDTIAAAKAVSLGESGVSGSIDTAGDIDYFSFTLEAGFPYVIETFNLTGGMDTIIYLFDNGGNFLTLDDNGGAEVGASKIEWTADKTGKYFAAVSHKTDTGTGGYSFRVRNKEVGKREGIWFGTYGGASFYDGKTYVNYTSSNSGLPLGSVKDIEVMSDGSKWFAVANTGVARLKDGVWTTYNTSNSLLPNNNINVIKEGADGSVWFGTNVEGAVRFDGINWTVYNSNNSGLKGYRVSDIVVEPSLTGTSGAVWFGTDRGAYRFIPANNRWESYTLQDSRIGGNFVISMDRGGMGLYISAS